MAAPSRPATSPSRPLAGLAGTRPRRTGSGHPPWPESPRSGANPEVSAPLTRAGVLVGFMFASAPQNRLAPVASNRSVWNASRPTTPTRWGFSFSCQRSVAWPGVRWPGPSARPAGAGNDAPVAQLEDEGHSGDHRLESGSPLGGRRPADGCGVPRGRPFGAWVVPWIPLALRDRNGTAGFPDATGRAARPAGMVRVRDGRPSPATRRSRQGAGPPARCVDPIRDRDNRGGVLAAPSLRPRSGPGTTLTLRTGRPGSPSLPERGTVRAEESPESGARTCRGHSH